MATNAAQPAPSTQATNPQPQTTVKPASTSFWQHSFPGNGPQYVTSFSGAGGGFATQITTPLTPVSGYYRRFRVTVTATGGTTSVTMTAFGNDAPFNAIQQVILKDASGNVNIINLPGWEALRLLPIISGASGLGRYVDPASYPYYQAPQQGWKTGAASFKFQSFLPLEFGAEGVGCIGGDNASVLPSLTFFTNASSVVYPYPPSTVPTLNVQVDADFWWNPDQPDLLPDGLGSSRQYTLLVGTPGVTSGSAVLVTLPKFGGGFVDSVTLIMRDSLGVRTDTGWPLRVQLYFDNVAYINETIDQIIWDMYNVLQLEGNTYINPVNGATVYPITAGGLTASDPYYNTAILVGPPGLATYEPAGTRPIGVLHFSFRNGVNQTDTGLEQSGLNYVSTTPGTNIQIGGTGWQNIFSDANTPYTITAIIGLVVPAGTLVTT